MAALDPTSSYYGLQSSRFRGSSYPSFAGGSVDQSGNVIQTPQVTNVSSHTPQVPETTPETINAGGVDATTRAGNPNTGLTGQFPSESSGPKTLGGQIGSTIANTVLPAAGSTFGTSVGTALSGGASTGQAFSAGSSAVGDLFTNPGAGITKGFGAVGDALSGVGDAIGGFLGGSGGAAASGATGNIAPVALKSVSELSGSGAASSVGSLGGGTLASSALGGFGAGLGTFAADLLSGKSLASAAKSGISTGIGAAIGTYVIPFPVVGTVVGGLLGGFVGSLFGPKPSVGPNGQTNFTANTKTGLLDIGASGADNGADQNVTLNAAKQSQTAINDYLTKNNLAIIKDDPLAVGSDGWTRMLSIGQGNAYTGPARSAQDVWNYLVKYGMVGPKPGYQAGNPAAGVNQQTASISGLAAASPVPQNEQTASFNRLAGAYPV